MNVVYYSGVYIIWSVHNTFGFKMWYSFITIKQKNRKKKLTGHEDLGREKAYISILPLTSALDGVGGQCHDPAALTPEKTWYPLNTRLGEPQGQSGRVQKILLPPGFDPQTLQPTEGHYTN